jgi:hypothetical protein
VIGREAGARTPRGRLATLRDSVGTAVRGNRGERREGARQRPWHSTHGCMGALRRPGLPATNGGRLCAVEATRPTPSVTLIPPFRIYGLFRGGYGFPRATRRRSIQAAYKAFGRVLCFKSPPRQRNKGGPGRLPTENMS